MTTIFSYMEIVKIDLFHKKITKVLLLVFLIQLEIQQNEAKTTLIPIQ